MAKKGMFRLVAVAAVALMLTGLYGLAAFTEVQVDRDVDVEVVEDTKDAAVLFNLSEDYSGESNVAHEDDGVVDFDLDRALDNAGGYNPDAYFLIGDVDEQDTEGVPEEEVFSITNQTGGEIDTNIVVALKDTEGTDEDVPAMNYTDVCDTEPNEGRLPDDTEITIEPGEEYFFDFEIDTLGEEYSDYDPGDIEAELEITEE